MTDSIIVDCLGMKFPDLDLPNRTEPIEMLECDECGFRCDSRIPGIMFVRLDDYWFECLCKSCYNRLMGKLSKLSKQREVLK